MELIPSVCSVVLYFILVSLPSAFLSHGSPYVWQNFITYIFTPAVFAALWGLVIYLNRDKPKTLWRFAAEWGITLLYMLFCAAAYGNALAAFNIYDKPGTVFFLFFPVAAVIPGSIPSGIANIVFPLLFAIPIIACLFLIIKNYRETGKLW